MSSVFDTLADVLGGGAHVHLAVPCQHCWARRACDGWLGRCRLSRAAALPIHNAQASTGPVEKWNEVKAMTPLLATTTWHLMASCNAQGLSGWMTSLARCSCR